tara:strand:+ start:22 stop:267 length:246 start_codon:yes stop_codon:yes gene_type:complete
MNILKFLNGLFKKKKPEKIRITIRDGKFMRAAIPANYAYHQFAAMQRIELYRAKLNGGSVVFTNGLGAFIGDSKLGEGRWL